MIVCCCKAVSSERIAALIAEGVSSVEAIGAICGAGTDCGSCRDQIEEMVEGDRPEPLALARSRSLRVLAAGAV